MIRKPIRLILSSVLLLSLTAVSSCAVYIPPPHHGAGIHGAPPGPVRVPGRIHHRGHYIPGHWRW